MLLLYEGGPAERQKIGRVIRLAADAIEGIEKIERSNEMNNTARAQLGELLRGSADWNLVALQPLTPSSA